MKWLAGGRSVGLVLLSVAACTDPESVEPVTVLETDSAGIAIIETRADTSGLREGWSIEPEPMLVIGGIDADESRQVFQVNGGVRLADGRIAIANGGTSEIRIFDGEGDPVASFGRQGEGPGEFMSPQLAGRLGADTLLVFDSQLRRISVLHAAGGYVDSYVVGAETGGFPLARGTVGRGNILLGGGMYFSSDEGFPTGLVRQPSRYIVVDPKGEPVGVLGDIPAAEMFASTDGSSFSASRIPFGKVTAIAAAGDRVWLGTGESWELRAFTPEAQLERIARIDWPLVPVTTALVDAFIEERVADARDADEAREVRNRYADMPRPAAVPPFELFLGDALGHLWIGEYLLPGGQVRTWTILDPDGRAVGRVTLPPRTLPLDIGADWLLGVTRDELDVESLTLWRLRRPGLSG